MTIIVTGHGHFASGLKSSLKLITGLEQVVHAVDFTEEMSSDELANQLKEIKEKSEEETLIFADIPGGTPFNQAVLLKSKYKDVEIVAGANLPLLIEVVLSNEPISQDTLNDFVETGKKGMMHYRESARRKNTIEDDGI